MQKKAWEDRAAGEGLECPGGSSDTLRTRTGLTKRFLHPLPRRGRELFCPSPILALPAVSLRLRHRPGLLRGRAPHQCSRVQGLLAEVGPGTACQTLRRFEGGRGPIPSWAACLILLLGWGAALRSNFKTRLLLPQPAELRLGQDLDAGAVRSGVSENLVGVPGCWRS